MKSPLTIASASLLLAMICPSHAEFITPLAVIVSNGEDTTESLIDGVGFTDDLPTADSAHIPDTGLWSGVGSINV